MSDPRTLRDFHGKENQGDASAVLVLCHLDELETAGSHSRPCGMRPGLNARAFSWRPHIGVEHSFLVPGLMWFVLLLCIGRCHSRRPCRDRIIAGKGDDARAALQHKRAGERKHQPGRYEATRKHGTEAAAAVEDVLHSACQF